jgi:urocanate hydratase
MPDDATTAATLQWMSGVYRVYAELMRFAQEDAEQADVHLGGNLLYAGELNAAGRTLTVAANIAGAATLAALADPAALRQAMREGVIDFLVNSLDEALRILKNEIRKRQTVSVAVSTAPIEIESAMLERGVLPDLLPSETDLPQASAFIAQGARRVDVQAAQTPHEFLVWQTPAEFAQRPAAFDAELSECLPAADIVGRRWLRVAPRYLGTTTRRLRSVGCDDAVAAKLVARFGEPLQR